jgi:hypothetical protein
MGEFNRARYRVTDIPALDKPVFLRGEVGRIKHEGSQLDGKRVVIAENCRGWYVKVLVQGYRSVMLFPNGQIVIG